MVNKGQLISKADYQAKGSSKKQTKTHCIGLKMNSFVRFFEEFTAW